MMIQTVKTNASGVYAGVCKCKVEEARDWREEGKPVVKGVSFELGPGRRETELGKDLSGYRITLQPMEQN